MPEPGNPQAFNRYSFSLSNPLKYTDPTGHRPCELECPGDWINPFEAMFGSAWYGPWGVEQQRANAARAEALVVGLGEFAAGVAWEPADWALTARDCIAGQCNSWAIIFAALPLLPSNLGKHVDEVFDYLKPGTLDNKAAREWYLAMEKSIKGAIDPNLSLEQQARLAFDLRNQIRTWARELMADRDEAARLMREEANLSWDQIIARAQAKGFSGDDIWRYIIEASQRSRESVNKLMGLEP
ncbi:MAG: hypothetical protein IT318_11630 [Anaerolineales bacterium]|nr:hypothetical protein [Anaerolineales bacterium]